MPYCQMGEERDDKLICWIISNLLSFSDNPKDQHFREVLGGGEGTLRPPMPVDLDRSEPGQVGRDPSRPGRRRLRPDRRQDRQLRR